MEQASGIANRRLKFLDYFRGVCPIVSSIIGRLHLPRQLRFFCSVNLHCSTWAVKPWPRHESRRIPQLLSVVTGDPFWTDDYDADLEVVDLFDFQDQVRDKIAATVGDVHGSIVDFERSLLEGLPLEELDPWQCICVTLGYDKFVDAEHHRVALAACERAAELAPEMPIAWGYLSWLYTDVWLIGWEADLDDPLQRAMEVARRSVELAPRGYMEAWLLSRVHFFRGELEAFREEGERSVRLAPQSATTVGLVGLYTMLSGNWERGRELIERARSINPVAPRYLHWPQAVDAYRRGEDEEALREQHRTGNEMNWIMQSLLPAILMRLGRESEAQAAWRKIESLNPDVDEAAVAEGLEKMNVRGALLESILVTLRPVMASV